jgi:hypothetical protein
MHGRELKGDLILSIPTANYGQFLLISNPPPEFKFHTSFQNTPFNFYEKHPLVYRKVSFII